MIKKFSFLIGILLFGLHQGQQNKEQLQKQNADLKKQIVQINTDLAKTRTESKLSVAYLTNVNKKLSLREKVYTNTQKEKDLLRMRSICVSWKSTARTKNSQFLEKIMLKF